MATIYIGHSSIDERGKIAGGKAGDQTGKEVCIRTYYVPSQGWYMLRPKSIDHANANAAAMKRACENDNIGYDQNERLGVVTHGTNTKTKIESDCGTLVRRCIIEAMGKDPGNFTTANEVACLEKTGLFEPKVAVTAKTVLHDGDVLVTKKKGHTAIVVSGNPRQKKVTKTLDAWAKEVIAGKHGTGHANREASLRKAGCTYAYSQVRAKVNELCNAKTTPAVQYYPKYTGSSKGIDTVFRAIGVPETFLGDYKNRTTIAKNNGIKGYTGDMEQNLYLISLAKQGKLKK